MSTKIDLEVKDKDYYHQTDPQYKLRWPKELRDKVAQSAKAYNRSMNADIIARLERSFLTESEFSPLNMPPEELEERLNRVLEKRALSNEPIECLDLLIQDTADIEKDNKIEKLEKKLDIATEAIKTFQDFIESVLSDKQDEFSQKLHTQYPELKKNQEK